MVFFIQEFRLGGLIIYHSFTLSEQICPLKEFAIFLEINVKWLFIQGVKKEFIVQHPAHFWPFLRAPAEKLMPDSQISFKSWLHNADSELYFFLSK